MLDPIWSLVIASALGMIGGLIPYKLFVSHLEESSSEEEFSARRQQGYYRYLIRHVSTQAIPILFLLYGMYFILSEGSASTSVTDVTPFLAAVILIIILGNLFPYLMVLPILRDPRTTEQMKNQTKGLYAVGSSLIVAVAIVSLGMLILIFTGQV